MEVVNLSQKPHLNSLLEDLPPLSSDIDLVKTIYKRGHSQMTLQHRVMKFGGFFVKGSEKVLKTWDPIKGLLLPPRRYCGRTSCRNSQNFAAIGALLYDA